MPVQPFDQAQKAEPPAGEADKVTTVPSAKFTGPHVEPQLICDACVGLLVDVTVPAPAPAFVTVSARRRRNSALTERACVIDTMQVPVRFAHAPVQPVKTDPDAAVAVRVTDVE